MIRRLLLAFSLSFLFLPAHAASRPQDTGFLNRTIEINGPGKGMKVRTRKGYYAPKQ